MRDEEVNKILEKLNNQEYPLYPVLENDIDYDDPIKLAEKITENVNFQYLEDELKLIKRVENVKAEFALYSLTSKGRRVLRKGGWLEYLKIKDKIEQRKEDKEEFELKITKAQSKYPYLPYWLAFGGVFVSFLAFINSCNSGNKTSQDKKETSIYIIQDTTLTKVQQNKTKYIDSLEKQIDSLTQ
ncbi:hypothetical protein BW723_16040 [Polaribacter reichenbachii]|uniref:Uncharacterized protein n=1 Tax=Polaribacter reichenbachii TaxID=996801 RepID=A0A1B8U251_9FLAO|nr:hypothetical protein [Polaribacter reichenbachii]APZ47711.1 hypothetical protein BW723_16040 [Polaribacter reichenbachii]AUC18346.1 hypothetical protein BTO17_06460 [Polaribacter reichenbachii]OBY65964.1 hypothetical protein LPB301_07565 [Polaribacter reichenbachii]